MVVSSFCAFSLSSACRAVTSLATFFKYSFDIFVSRTGTGSEIKRYNRGRQNNTTENEEAPTWNARSHEQHSLSCCGHRRATYRWLPAFGVKNHEHPHFSHPLAQLTQQHLHVATFLYWILAKLLLLRKRHPNERRPLLCQIRNYIR